MDNEQRQFLRNLMHTVLNALIYSVIWRLPFWIALGLLAIVVLAIWQLRLF